MADDSIPTSSEVHILPDPPRGNEPDSAIVGNLLSVVAGVVRDLLRQVHRPGYRRTDTQALFLAAAHGEELCVLAAAAAQWLQEQGVDAELVQARLVALQAAFNGLLRWSHAGVYEVEDRAGDVAEALQAVRDLWQQPVDPAAVEQSANQSREVLTDNEYTVLRALKDNFPRLVLLADLVANTTITRKTCGDLVNSLINRGLVVRRSKRTGATITPTGEALLDARPTEPLKDPLTTP